MFQKITSLQRNKLSLERRKQGMSNLCMLLTGIFASLVLGQHYPMLGLIGLLLIVILMGRDRGRGIR
jgi:hypothetical protein